MRSDKIWDDAIEQLNDEDRKKVNVPEKHDVLLKLLSLAESKKEDRERRKWRITRKNGEVVIVTDVLQKLVKWVRYFRATGDNMVQYDPGHAAVPWACVRFILEVRSPPLI